MAKIQLKNNFKVYKNEFKTDTGLDPDKNIELYIHYFNARVNDVNMQINGGIAHNIINQLERMPEDIAKAINVSGNQL